MKVEFRIFELETIGGEDTTSLIDINDIIDINEGKDFKDMPEAQRAISESAPLGEYVILPVYKKIKGINR